MLEVNCGVVFDEGIVMPRRDMSDAGLIMFARVGDEIG